MGKNFFGILLLAIQPFCCLSAQPLSRGDEILSRFDCRFRELDSLILNRNAVSRDSSGIRYAHRVSVKDLYDEGVYEDKYEADIKTMKSRNGFEITGQTYYRLDEGMGLDEEDAVSRYNAKVQLELAWNFFNSSFFKRKGKAREILLENRVAQNRFERDLRMACSNDMRERLRARYESLMAGLLIHRIENLELLYLAGQETIVLLQIKSEIRQVFVFLGIFLAIPILLVDYFQFVL